MIRALSCIALLILLSFTAHADTLGPITMGGGPFYALGFNATSVGFQGNPFFQVDPSHPSYSQTTTFTFDVAPGWTIDSIHLIGPGLVSGTVPFNLPPEAPSGIEYSEVLTLCPTVGACATSSNSFFGGTASLPPLPSNPIAGPGTGVFQIDAYVVNAFLAVDQPLNQGLIINVSQTSSVPEPPSLALLGTGALGLLAAAGLKFLAQ